MGGSASGGSEFGGGEGSCREFDGDGDGWGAVAAAAYDYYGGYWSSDSALSGDPSEAEQGLGLQDTFGAESVEEDGAPRSLPACSVASVAEIARALEVVQGCLRSEPGRPSLDDACGEFTRCLGADCTRTVSVFDLARFTSEDCLSVWVVIIGMLGFDELRGISGVWGQTIEGLWGAYRALSN